MTAGGEVCHWADGSSSHRMTTSLTLSGLTAARRPYPVPGAGGTCGSPWPKTVHRGCAGAYVGHFGAGTHLTACHASEGYQAVQHPGPGCGTCAMSACHSVSVSGSGAECTGVAVVDGAVVQPATTSTARAPEIAAKAGPRRCPCSELARIHPLQNPLARHRRAGLRHLSAVAKGLIS